MGGRYCSEKDKILLSKSIKTDFDRVSFLLEVYSYDNGPPKLAIKRVVAMQDREVPKPLGRLFIADLEKILPIIIEILPKMKEYDTKPTS